MATGKEPTLRPVRVPRPSNSGKSGSPLPDVPERVPARTVAPIRVGSPEGDGPAPTREELFEALQTFAQFWDGHLAHRRDCMVRNLDCECGLNGLRRYLRGE